jgi:hypothetical protein
MSYCRRRTWRPPATHHSRNWLSPGRGRNATTWASGRSYQAALCSPGEPATGPPAAGGATAPAANPSTTAATTLSTASATARESIPTGPQWRTTPPRSMQNPADAASGKPGNEQRIAIPGLTARRSSSAPAPSAATSGHHDRTGKRLDRSPSGRPVSKHAGRSELETMPDTRPRRPAAPHAACSGHGCSVP